MISYSKLGGIAKEANQLAKALEYYEKDLEIALQLAEKTGTVESRRDLSLSYERLGSIAKRTGQLAKAREYYEKSLAIRRKLAEEMKTAGSYDDLAISYYNLGCIEDSHSREKSYFLKALEIWEALAKSHPDVFAYKDRRDTVRIRLI